MLFSSSALTPVSFLAILCTVPFPHLFLWPVTICTLDSCNIPLIPRHCCLCSPQTFHRTMLCLHPSHWPVLQHLWNITMVQLVSLMYRDQQQGTIRKLINEWLESSLAESSEDDENNPMSSSSSVSPDNTSLRPSSPT